MKLLALDTALDACSAAIAESNGGHCVMLARRVGFMRRGHAEALMPMVAKVVEESGADLHNIDRIAVTIGPGTFSGVRIALSAARGLGLVIGCPVIGITTLEAVAANAAEIASAAGELDIATVLDARRDEVYMQLFSSTLVPHTEARLCRVDEVREMLRVRRCVAVGSGAGLVIDPERHMEAPESAALPDPLTIARIAANRPAPSAPPVPFYLRAPDATPMQAEIAFAPARGASD